MKMIKMCNICIYKTIMYIIIITNNKYIHLPVTRGTIYQNDPLYIMIIVIQSIYNFLCKIKSWFKKKITFMKVLHKTLFDAMET